MTRYKTRLRLWLASLFAALMVIAVPSAASAAGWNTPACNAYGSDFNITVATKTGGGGMRTSLAPGRCAGQDSDSFYVHYAGRGSCWTYVNGSPTKLAAGWHNTAWWRNINLVGVCG